MSIIPARTNKKEEQKACINVECKVFPHLLSVYVRTWHTKNKNNHLVDMARYKYVIVNMWYLSKKRSRVTYCILRSEFNFAILSRSRDIDNTISRYLIRLGDTKYFNFEIIIQSGDANSISRYYSLISR